MPPVFWTGKLSLPMLLMVNINNLLAYLLGHTTNLAEIKSRVRNGYEGNITADVKRYDELGLALQERSADFQLSGIDLAGLTVLDVGCGSGVLAMKALGAGAKNAVCGDISMLMLELAQHKQPVEHTSMRYCQLDAEALPFADESFDVTLTGMSFGLFPDQPRALREMMRVTKPGGLIGLGAHGPEHYWEAIDGCLRYLNKIPLLGYRLDWWPRNEAYLLQLTHTAGLTDIRSSRKTWQTRFSDGGAMYDFFCAISASFWFDKYRGEAVQGESERVRTRFRQHNLETITDDVIVLWGRNAG